MFNELIKVIKNNKVMFHFFTFGFNITTEVINYEIKDDCIFLYIHDGKIIIGEDYKIEKCCRPSNLIIECEHCFSLTNNYDKHIGYIYCLKENKEHNGIN